MAEFLSNTLICVSLVAALSVVTADAGSSSTIAQENAASSENWKMVHITLWAWASIVGVLLVYRWSTTLLRHVRRIANLNQGTSSDNRQRYFSIPNEDWARVKRHFILAPILRKRHHREFRLSAAVNVGTLPSRIEFLFLFGYLTINVITVAVGIDWDEPNSFYDDARNRTGVLATLNLIPLFVLAGRNNPLIWLLGISFDAYNLIHRWIGRIVVLEALAHAAFWMAGKVHEMGSAKGWQTVLESFHSQMIYSGTIGAAAVLAILLQSQSIVRHAFYETFWHVHVVLVILAICGIWIHLEGMPQAMFLKIAITSWIIERSLRVIWLIRRNIGTGVTKAEVEKLPGDAVRITLRIAKPWKFRPGQHVYLSIPSIGLWTSHPFSLAWSQDVEIMNGEKPLPTARQDRLATRTASMSMVVRQRTGFTNRLYKKAERSPSGKFMATAFVEGPYGDQTFQSYGTVMLFAAGIGITHQVPHVRDLVAAYANGTAATRKVILVWVIRSPKHLEWIRPWMTQILGMEKRREVLKVLLFVSQPRSYEEVHSPTSSVQMYPGKPDIPGLIVREQETQIGAMAISVCGTGSLSDDVRRAMRESCQRTEIDFFEESFSW